LAADGNDTILVADLSTRQRVQTLRGLTELMVSYSYRS
jgi:hypothetical protein